MFSSKKIMRLFMVVTMVLFSFSCSTGIVPKRSSKAIITVSVSSDINPDLKGRPSPIVLYIYQLKSDDGFNNAPFFELYDNAESVLGSDKTGVMEYEMSPRDQFTIEKFVLDEDTKYLGFFAAYRDVNASVWRVSKPIKPHKKSLFNVALGRSEIVVTRDK